jgi:dihydroorotate dehydrogenase
MYSLIRNILFLFDPEKVHYFSMNILQFLCKMNWIRFLIKKIYSSNKPTTAMGLTFVNSVGLGAGFDKNAKYLSELEALGFGFVEIGTVTPKAQDGNETPRLFRLPKDKALINRMGFNNEGADIISNRMAHWRKKNPNTSLIVGGNIGKNKLTPNEAAWKDYEICFEKLYDYVDYFVVNVSSPNTPGLRALQEKDSLQKLFSVLQKSNQSKKIQKPILLKIAPDLNQHEIDDIIQLSKDIKMDGLIVSNTTIDRSTLHTNSTVVDKIGAGGVSGLPVKDRSTSLIQYIHQQTNGSLLIIGSGGIFNGEGAAEKIHAGASLIQVWTGFVYEGPSIVKNISTFLSKKSTI